jgi:geranylgeranyl diphosphate synthase type I
MIYLQQQFQTDFETQLNLFLEQFSFYSKTSKNIYTKLKEILLSKKSKRLRPFLTKIGFQIFKNPTDLDSKNLLHLQIALELFQAYCLIHDDIIDNSPLRRGIKTIHTIFKEKYNNQNIGISAGILAGDLASTLADLSFNKIQTNNFTVLASLYAEMKLELIDGQIDDVFDTGLASLESLTEEQILRTIDNKSGRYSIQKPLLFGAVLANSDDDQILKLSKIGQDLGLIFQLIDDIIGIFGDAKSTGKPDISDITEGKRTLLMLYTFDASNSSEKTFIKKILGNPKATSEEIQELKNLIKKTKADIKIKQKCVQIQSRVLETLNQLQTENPAIQYLKDFSQYLLDRAS